MTRSHCLALALVLMPVCALSVAAQTYQLKSIHFKGDSEHTQAELSAAADLQKGASLTMPQINDHTKLLMDTGMFQNVAFTFNSQDLTYELTPVTDLYSVRLENLPVNIGNGLDDRLHARLPLYHGKVPSSGSLLDGIQKELQDELAASGIQATIAVTPFTDIAVGKVTAMSFAIVDPDVQVGQIALEGASAPFIDKVKAVLGKSTGTAYSFDGSPNQLQTNLVNFYGAQGYLEAKVQALPVGNAVADANAVHIPFHVTVEEGVQYKLAGVELAPGLIVSQADFDKVSGLHSGEVVSLVKLRTDWELLAHLYHNHGYMQAEIRPVATLDRTSGTASYTVSADPGPVYTTGKVRVRNVSDEIRGTILAALKLPAGEPFNEGAVRTLAAAKGPDASLQRIFASYTLAYTANRHEDSHTIDVDITLEPKHP